MSLDVLTAIWRDPPCGGGDLLCLLAIADNADENGYAWPSMETIARKANLSERGARKCVSKLEKAGVLRIEKGGGRNKTNGYQITTNGIGEQNEHKNPEQNSVNPSSGYSEENPEQRDINPEPQFHKPGTPVPPNSQEPPREPSEPPKSPTDILCQVVSRETAEDFAAHRKLLKSPITDLAAKRIVNALADHPDPQAVLDLSIREGWKGIFPEKVTPKLTTINGGRNESPSHPNRVQRIVNAAAAGTSSQDWG